MEESESERCGKKRREESSPVSTKSLPQCVFSILSISKAGPPAHSFVVVCSYLVQPYPHTLRNFQQFVLRVVVVRVFIDTQNRLVVLHSVPIKTHEETDISGPHSVIYRPVGSTMQLVTKTESPQFLTCSRTIGTWSPHPRFTETFSCQVSTS